MSNSILIIEDDRDLCDLLTIHLTDMNFAVEVAHDGLTGLAKALRNEYSLITLDVMLPGLDGLELCRQLRAGDRYVPILMLTARSSETDRVVGLEIGADDYLTKPFSIPEFLARVKAIIRRVKELQRSTGDQMKPLSIRDLHIDPQKRQVFQKDRPIDLTAREFDLLLHFARHPGIVFSRKQLLDAVWGYAYDGYEHTVNSHINRLRTKLERDHARPEYIMTVRGVGYKLADRK